MKISKYESYKSTEIQWAEKVPSHWETKQLRYVCTCEDGKRIPLNSEERSAKQGQYPYWGANGIVDYVDEWLFDEELVLLGEDGAPFLEANKTVCFLSKGKIWPNNHIHVLRPKEPGTGAFITQALNTADYSNFITGSTRDKLNQAAMNGIKIPWPSVHEKIAIAKFLDRETAKIDSLVAEQERLIELLKEKRQAVISHAVTKGLNPDARMKDSGVEWLGEVPEHWKRLPIFRAARQDRKCFTDGDWIESPFITEEGVRLIQTGNIGIGIYREKGFKFVSSQTFEDLKCTEVETGDLLICRLDGPVGRACLAPDLGVKMITSVDNAILKARENISTEFLMYIFSSLQWLEWIQAICRVGGGFRLRISRTQLGEQRICMPPIEEQIEICDQIRSESKKIDDLTSSAKQSIELLKERRSALISAAVTGQIDVQGLTKEEAA